MAAVDFVNAFKLLPSQPTHINQLNPRHGTVSRVGQRSLHPGEAVGLTVFLLVVFAIGISLVVHRNKQLSRQEGTANALRKREGKGATAPKLSARRPQEHSALMEGARNDAQNSYLRYWGEPPPRSKTVTNEEGIVLGTICSCDVCRAMLDGFS